MFLRMVPAAERRSGATAADARPAGAAPARQEMALLREAARMAVAFMLLSCEREKKERRKKRERSLMKVKSCGPEELLVSSVDLDLSTSFLSLSLSLPVSLSPLSLFTHGASALLRFLLFAESLFAGKRETEQIRGGVSRSLTLKEKFYPFFFPSPPSLSLSSFPLFFESFLNLAQRAQAQDHADADPVAQGTGAQHVGSGEPGGVAGLEPRVLAHELQAGRRRLVGRRREAKARRTEEGGRGGDHDDVLGGAEEAAGSDGDGAGAAGGGAGGLKGREGGGRG